MLKKLSILSGLLLIHSVGVATSQILGTQSCLTTDQIIHTPGSDWQLTESSGWQILKDEPHSTMVLSDMTPVKRDVVPYHNPLTQKLAVVTCHYADDQLVIQRTYEEGDSSYKDANYITADSNLNLDKNFDVVFYNAPTSCETTLGHVDQCPWYFVSYSTQTYPPDMVYSYGWL